MKKPDGKKQQAATPKVVSINTADEKEVVWCSDSLKEEIRNEWPEQARKDVGFELGRVQQGLDPDHYREMPSIAPGVREIKVQDENKSQYRLLYVAKFEECIYVLHVITKKTTEQTDKRDIEISKKRFKEIVEKSEKGPKE